MNIKNLSEAVLNDNSMNNIIYYFNGESHPYIQLNASGTTDAQHTDTVLTGSKDSPIRELKDKVSGVIDFSYHPPVSKRYSEYFKNILKYTRKYDIKIILKI